MLHWAYPASVRGGEGTLALRASRHNREAVGLGWPMMPRLGGLPRVLGRKPACLEGRGEGRKEISWNKAADSCGSGRGAG